MQDLEKPARAVETARNSTRPVKTGRPPWRSFEETAEVNGEGKDDGRASLPDNSAEGAEITKLHGLGGGREDLGGFQQPLRRLLFIFIVDDRGSPLALHLGLPVDRTDHALASMSTCSISTLATLIPQAVV